MKDYYIEYDLGRGRKFLFVLSTHKFVLANEVNDIYVLSTNYGSMLQSWEKAIKDIKDKFEDKSGQLNMYEIEKNKDINSNSGKLIKTMDMSYLKNASINVIANYLK